MKFCHTTTNAKGFITLEKTVSIYYLLKYKYSFYIFSGVRNSDHYAEIQVR